MAILSRQGGFLKIENTTSGLIKYFNLNAFKFNDSTPIEGDLLKFPDGSEYDYNDISSPSLASTEEFADLIGTYKAEIFASGGGGGGVVVVGGATWTPNTSWNGNTVYSTTLAVSGALTTDVCFANINGQFATDIDGASARVEEISAFVSSANTVTVRASITSFTTLTATASIKVVVLR